MSLSRLLGLENVPVTHAERLVSALGGFIAIATIFYISQKFVHGIAAYVIIASMGASAVLIFAVPHGQLSQPWPVLAGHFVSALIGVLCALWIPDTLLAASTAVGLAIAVMYYLRCVHPPGGATALTAVMGGEHVHDLSFQFILTPVLLNAFIIVLVGVSFNYLFKWRRYPLSLHRRQQTDQATKQGSINHEDFVYALSQMDSFVDISEHQLLNLYELATTKSQSGNLSASQIQLGKYYSNGKYGPEWSVRQIVDISAQDKHDNQTVIYKTVAGEGRRQSGYMSMQDFMHWAKHELIRDEENWKRLDNT